MVEAAPGAKGGEGEELGLKAGAAGEAGLEEECVGLQQVAHGAAFPQQHCYFVGCVGDGFHYHHFWLQFVIFDF